MLEGYKTYIVAGLLAVVEGAAYLGWLTAEAAVAIRGILLGGGLAALRSGVAGK